MAGSSERIFWYLFNGFLHVQNSVVDFFFPTKTSVDLPWEEMGGGVDTALPQM
jgi:hypothetical protein